MRKVKRAGRACLRVCVRVHDERAREKENVGSLKG